MPKCVSLRIVALCGAVCLAAPWAAADSQNATAPTAAGVAAAAVEVPLTVCERGGAARKGGIATGGIPLPEAASVTDLSRLRVLDAAGDAVPAQFLPLDRWQAAPGRPVRWCLVSFPAMVQAGGQAAFTLKLAGADSPAPPPTPLKVTDDPDGVTVVTGPLKFRVSKRNFNLFDGVWLDPAGRFGPDSQVVAPASDGGAVLTTGDWPEEGLKAGDRYGSAAGAPAKVVIEEKGPVRACIFVQGSHLPAGGGGFAPGVYDYKVRIYAYAGQPHVRVIYTLANSRLDRTMRTWPIQSLSLTTRLAGGVRTARIAGLADGRPFDVAAGGGLAMMQTVDDSNARQRRADKGPAPVASATQGGKAVEPAAGRSLPGVIDVCGERNGVAVGMKYFAAMCPKGLAADGAGVRVELFPRTDRTYYILPGRKRVHELVYLFHPAKDAAAALAAAAGIKDQELRPLAPPRWYQASRAWFGGMGVVDPKICPHAQTPAIEPTGLYATWYGYGFFGRDWNSGGQHPHHDSAIWPWVLGGGSDQGRYIEAEALCRWIADLGVGSVMDEPTDYSVLNPKAWADRKLNDFFKFMGGGGFNDDSRFRNYRLDMSYRTYPGGPTRLEAGGPFELIGNKIDSGHLGLICLHEFYRLTGDRDVLETMDAVATMSRSLIRLYVCPPAILHFVEKDNPEDPKYRTQDRYIGWPLYEMADAYSRTGNPLFAREMSVIVRAIRNRARTSPVGFIAVPVPASEQGGYAHSVAAREGASQVDALFQTGILANGLARCYIDTGDFEALDALTAFADHVTHFAMTRGGDGRMKGWWYVWSDCWTPGVPGIFNGFGSSAVRVYRPLSVAYDATGRADYRAVSTAACEALGAPARLDDAMGLEMQGFLYPHQCPKTGAPPAAVKDLRAEALGGGRVRLTWTAPGDENNKGRAARYQVKCSTDPIVERVAGWPDRTPPLPQTVKEWEDKAAAFMARNGRAFWSAANLPDAPAPAAAGTAESYVATGLAPGKCWFALKTYSRSHNQSELSNVVSVEVR